MKPSFTNRGKERKISSPQRADKNYRRDTEDAEEENERRSLFKLVFGSGLLLFRQGEAGGAAPETLQVVEAAGAGAEDVHHEVQVVH